MLRYVVMAAEKRVPLLAFGTEAEAEQALAAIFSEGLPQERGWYPPELAPDWLSRAAASLAARYGTGIWEWRPLFVMEGPDGCRSAVVHLFPRAGGAE